MKFFVTYLSALLFGLGLGISGMTNPQNVIGFLDLFGDWNPALVLVMVGAIAFHSISYFLITKRSSPLLANTFLLPSNKSVDGRLIVGSTIFGIGWGMGGFCPGPAIVSLVTLDTPVLIFVISMVGGIAFFHYIFRPFLLREKR